MTSILKNGVWLPVKTAESESHAIIFNCIPWLLYEKGLFALLINKGKIHLALDKLKEGHRSGILHLDD